MFGRSPQPCIELATGGSACVVFAEPDEPIDRFATDLFVIETRASFPEHCSVLFPFSAIALVAIKIAIAVPDRLCQILARHHSRNTQPLADLLEGHSLAAVHDEYRVRAR